MIIWLFCSLFSILFSLNIRHDFINRRAQLVLPGDNTRYLGIEFCNINHLAGVFLRSLGHALPPDDEVASLSGGISQINSLEKTGSSDAYCITRRSPGRSFLRLR